MRHRSSLPRNSAKHSECPGVGSMNLGIANRERNGTKTNSGKGKVIVRILKALFFFSKIKAKRKGTQWEQDNCE